MPIPFRDADDLDDLGSAAFLKLEPGPAATELLGALLIVSPRGEPLEFAYNRIELPDTFLWRRADLRRHAERKLAASLLTVCARTPRLLLALADDIGSELFCQGLRLEVPVARIGRPLKANAYSLQETEEQIDQPEPLHLFWFPAPPAPESPERHLFDRLRSRGLLLEPFERAAQGLMEVYSAKDAEQGRGC